MIVVEHRRSDAVWSQKTGNGRQGRFFLSHWNIQIESHEVSCSNLSTLRPPCHEDPDTSWPTLGSLVDSFCLLVFPTWVPDRWVRSLQLTLNSSPCFIPNLQVLWAEGPDAMEQGQLTSSIQCPHLLSRIEEYFFKKEKMAVVLKHYIKEWGFPSGSGGKEFACNSRDLGSIPGSWRAPGKVN